jgi:hypothetical protein
VRDNALGDGVVVVHLFSLCYGGGCCFVPDRLICCYAVAGAPSLSSFLLPVRKSAMQGWLACSWHTDTRSLDCSLYWRY